ncbi:MAG TPA: glycine cleavage system aminomethyltransferase GcvT [Candidatus Acidoferrales bacterium]|nr:glycine cleavage system aminomethyltransferase GcvT [Candidatus Acidoferrales bacterium]
MLTQPRETALYKTHVGLGAKMSPFGGFLMPIVYSSILDEHDAVRTAVGMFDLSHMGQFIATGDGVAAWLDRLTANDVATMRPNQARYNIFTNPAGGAHDDVIIYRLDGRWLVVVNAANTAKIWELLSGSKPVDVKLDDRTPRSALIALQGPKAVALLQTMSDLDLSTVRYYYAADAKVSGVAAEIARTGYTGEDGFEVFIPAEKATELWDRFLTDGRQFGLRPAGLGARDVLRLEAGMPLYGHELDENISPLQASLNWVVKFDKEFTGKAALQAQRAEDTYDRIAGLVMEGKAPARAGYPVLRDGTPVGEIRSGSPAPALGGKNIATALVRKDAAAAGTPLAVQIRGTAHPAVTVEMPFYKRKK